MSESHPAQLHRLARMHGIETHYTDGFGQWREASPETLLAVIRAMGTPVAGAFDAARADRLLRRERLARVMPPVAVAWHRSGATVRLTIPAAWDSHSARASIEFEDGETRQWYLSLGDLETIHEIQFDGTRHLRKRLVIAGPMPWGHHRLTLEVAGAREECLILSAPIHAHHTRPDDPARDWGVFIPLYAAHGEKSWGAGDFGDLERLVDWTAELGGGVVATLPCLAAFLDEPFEPSPYSPASRLHWNEFYLDPTAIPGFADCSAAREMVASQSFQEEVAKLNAAPLVDYRQAAALKRAVLDQLARAFFAATAPGLRERYEAYLRERPGVEDYARFRAATETFGRPWREWPGRARRGDLRQGDYHEDNLRHHLFAQWQCDEQIGRIARRAREAGPGLYLDLPLGVNANGYDVWRDHDSFATGVSAGAPPDGFFTRGQRWGFSPPHPELQRRSGYRYLVECYRHHLRHAGILRLDHVMGLHRLYWIPDGMEEREGVYVRYPARENYAILTLESRRAGALLVGEDLGTVPAAVPRAMDRHKLMRMYVTQFNIDIWNHPKVHPAPRNCVASVNTHDTPTFASFWRGEDAGDRHDLGLIDAATAEQEKKNREGLRSLLLDWFRHEGLLAGDGAGEGEPEDLEFAALRASLRLLASGDSRIALVSLEDLWLEPLPQNTPGVGPETRPSWRRKAAPTLEAFTTSPRVLETLREFDRLRRKLQP